MIDLLHIEPEENIHTEKFIRASYPEHAEQVDKYTASFTKANELLSKDLELMRALDEYAEKTNYAVTEESRALVEKYVTNYHALQDAELEMQDNYRALQHNYINSIKGNPQLIFDNAFEIINQILDLDLFKSSMLALQKAVDNKIKIYVDTLDEFTNPPADRKERLQKVYAELSAKGEDLKNVLKKNIEYFKYIKKIAHTYNYESACIWICCAIYPEIIALSQPETLSEYAEQFDRAIAESARTLYEPKGELLKSPLHLIADIIKRRGELSSPDGSELNIQPHFRNLDYLDIVSKTRPTKKQEKEKSKLSKETSNEALEKLAEYNEKASTKQLSLWDNEPYKAMVEDSLTNELMGITTKALTPDKITGNAVIKKDGRTILIEGYNNLRGELGVSAKKILDTSTVILSEINTYRGDPDRINPTVRINLAEYAKANGYNIEPTPQGSVEEMEKDAARIQDTLKELKATIKRDLTTIAAFSQTFTEADGLNKGDYQNVRIISSHSIRKGIIEINFDANAARYLMKAHQTQYPTALLKHDNRNPNSYPIGRRLAVHYFMDSNVLNGTNETISVKSLLESAPEIISYEELRNQGRRDWKVKIKDKLEKALDDNKDIGFLEYWDYIQGTGKKGKPIDKKDAAALSWADYSELYINFRVIDAPDQTERLKANAEKRALAKAKAEEKRAKKNKPVKK